MTVFTAVAVALIALLLVTLARVGRHHLYLLVRLRRWPDENDLALRRRVTARRAAAPTPPPAPTRGPATQRPDAPAAAVLRPELVPSRQPSTALIPARSAVTFELRRPAWLVAIGLLGLVAAVRVITKSR